MNTILHDWPYVGLVLGGLLLAWLIFEKREPGAPPRWQDPAWVLPLLWPMYLLHQFEEHGIDLLGRHYAFLGDLCTSLGYAQGTWCPADPAFVFAVNVVACQLDFAMSWVFRRKNPLLAACAWGIPLVNAVAHLGPAIAHLTYGAGVFTSLILFIPLCALMLRTVLRSGVIELRQVPRIVATGVLVHVVLMVSLILYGHSYISHGALLLINAANGLWPLAFGTIGVRRTAQG
jgi:hypothetical protein